MLRKPLIVCLFLFALPYSALAISHAELKQNPSKYALVYDSPNSTVLIDVNSIKVLQNKHPFVAVQVDFYTVLYGSKMIFKDTTSYAFNMRAIVPVRIPKIEKAHPEYTSKKESEEIISKQISTSGIFYTLDQWEAFNVYGDPYPNTSAALIDLISREERKELFSKARWEVCKYMFAKLLRPKYTAFGLPAVYTAYWQP